LCETLKKDISLGIFFKRQLNILKLSEMFEQKDYMSNRDIGNSVDSKESYNLDFLICFNKYRISLNSKRGRNLIHQKIKSKVKFN